MPILFLDVDGVLNCRATNVGDPGVRECVLQRPYSTTRFVGVVEIAKVQALARVIAACRGKIVVSSSWRKAFASAPAFNAAIGLTPPLANASDLLHRDWHTGWKPNSSRHHEISWWLDDHPGVKHFAILDDHAVCANASKLTPHFVHTDAEVGLTDVDLCRVATLLGCRRAA